MSTIKIHLEEAERLPVERLAELLHVEPEDVAYAALDMLMLRARDEKLQQDILQISHRKINSLPLWADTAHSVHAYEGMRDVESEQSRFSV